MVVVHSGESFMNIEYAPKEYQIQTCSYQDSVLYCFQLEIYGIVGWRLPTLDEYSMLYSAGMIEGAWYEGLTIYNATWKCAPIRTKESYENQILRKRNNYLHSH